MTPDRIPVSPEATTLHDSLTATMRTITTALNAGFTTPGSIDLALAAVGAMQDELPKIRRELRAMRAGIRRAA